MVTDMNDLNRRAEIRIPTRPTRINSFAGAVNWPRRSWSKSWRPEGTPLKGGGS